MSLWMATEAPLAASSLVKGGPAMRLFGSWGVYAVNVMLLYTILMDVPSRAAISSSSPLITTSTDSEKCLSEEISFSPGIGVLAANGICGDEEGMALAVASVV